jgi:hypothetical protein
MTRLDRNRRSLDDLSDQATAFTHVSGRILHGPCAQLKARGIRILVPLRGTPKMMKSSSRAIPKQCGRNDAGGLMIGGFALGGNP